MDYKKEAFELITAEAERKDSPIITSDNADNYIYGAKQIFSEIAEIESRFNSEIDRLKYWKQTEIEKLENKLEFINLALEGFYCQSDFKKTQKFPSGNIGYRKLPDKVVVNDSDSYIAWVKKAGLDERTDLIKTKVTPDKKGIKLYITQSGEIPDGVEMVTGENKFYIK